jgi:hypothetical protein
MRDWTAKGRQTKAQKSRQHLEAIPPAGWSNNKGLI